MDLTPAELTALELVVEQPRNGDDLQRVISQRGIQQWTDIGPRLGTLPGHAGLTVSLPFLGGRVKPFGITQNLATRPELDRDIRETTSVRKAWDQVRASMDGEVPVGLPSTSTGRWATTSP